jgi:hypothetical protein
VTEWSFAPIFDSYVVAGIAAAVLLALLAVPPSYGRLSRSRRFLLTTLRLAVVLLIVFALLRPTRVQTVTRTEPATLIVLADRSRSMGQPHMAGGQSRWDAQRAAVDAARAAAAELSRDLEVRSWTYSQSLQPFDFQQGLAAASLDGSTDMGTAVRTAVRGQLGRRLAGVVLLGDGVQTVAAPEVELDDAARELARLGCPLYTVAFGPAGAAAQARDVAVENLPDQYTVFVKNELLVRGLVRVNGYVNQGIPVELTIANERGESRSLGTRTVAVPLDGGQVDVAFPFAPQETGTYKLTLTAAPRPGELTTQNNALGAYLHVLEGGLKVLYLEGQLRHEQRFIARALDASPDVDLDFQWLDSRRRTSWPVDLSAVLEKPRFDVLIIGDLDASALGPQQLEAIAAAVRSGRGLAMLGGYHSFGAGGYGESPLAAALPIKMDKFERQNFDEPPREDLHWPGPLRIEPARDHPLTRLGVGRSGGGRVGGGGVGGGGAGGGGGANPAGKANDNAVNANNANMPDLNAADAITRWRALPPLEGANRFRGVSDAPGVQVILETADKAPMLVSRDYGEGRVLAFAGDSTWRWSMRGFQDEHRRFWRQIILWLARREDQVRYDTWIRLAQRRVNLGARLAFTAGVRAPNGEPIEGAELAAELIDPQGQRSPLRLSRNKSEWNGVVERTGATGDYRIEIRAMIGGKPAGQTRGEFLVFDQDLELATAAADHEQLARLAEATREFGGSLVPAEKLPELLRDIASRSRQFKVEVQTQWRLGDTALDAWLFFIAVATLLSFEWLLRKRWSLH